jgi:hypothetical protein
MKIYDCFTFYNELELLDLRLAELYDHVDKFVIVESTKTFQGNDKSLFLKLNWNRYIKYHDKIVHVVVDDSPCSANAWDNEAFQRDAIMRGLVTAEPEDICIIGDVDEILRPKIVDDLRTSTAGMMGFRVPYFNFKFNYMLINDPESYSVWTTACRFKVLHSPNSFRSSRFDLNGLPMNYKDEYIQMYEHAGWHFTYLGDKEFIRNKIRSFSHAELNYDDFLDKIDVDDMMARGVGFNPTDPRRFIAVTLDDYFPQTLINDTEKYATMIASGATKSARKLFS